MYSCLDVDVARLVAPETSLTPITYGPLINPEYICERGALWKAQQPVGDWWFMSLSLVSGVTLAPSISLLNAVSYPWANVQLFFLCWREVVLGHRGELWMFKWRILGVGSVHINSPLLSFQWSSNGKKNPSCGSFSGKVLCEAVWFP